MTSLSKKAEPTVVYVRFPNGKEFPYLNDSFELNEGDFVYVDGKFEGMLGSVTEVLSSFKVSLKYYKRVVEKVDFSVKGSFERFEDFYVSLSKNDTPYERIIRWFMAPEREEPEEFVCGKGYEITLEMLDSPKNYTIGDYYGGEEILLEGGVKAISVANGSGYAIIKSDKTYTVNFEYDGKKMTNVFCDCISPKLCDDMTAVAIVLNKVSKSVDLKNNFTIFEKNVFWAAVNNSKSKIKI